MRLQSQYFPEIDGLRGLAVILVLIFHLGYQWLPGGFIGVDVFFVISGYLITRLVLRQLDEGRFTFSGFYMRRVRRLVPAMLVTIACTLIVGFALLSLSDFRQLGPMALTSLLGVANFYFSAQGDYFSNEAAVDPLLHFWSLAVEEQYYLVEPLATLLVFYRYSFRGVFIASAVVFILSFLAAMMLYSDMPRSVFYWPFFRAWELTLGALLVWMPRPTQLISIISTLLGGIFILASALFFSADIGGWAPANLIPCAGAALVIIAAENPVKRLVFGNPVSVVVGRISYSLYLVHWPIIVYILYIQSGDHLSGINKILAVILSVIVAGLLYKFVEQRFRYSQSTKNTGGNRRFLLGTLVCLLALNVLSVSIALGSGWRWRLSSNVAKSGEGYGACKRETFCSLGQGAENQNSFYVILIGDSHAKHLSSGLQNWAERTGAKALVATSPSCIPIVGLPSPRGERKACGTLRKKLQPILDQNPLADIIVAQSWLGYKNIDQILEGYSKLLKSRPQGSVLLVGQLPKLPEHKIRCGTMHDFLLPKDICDPFPKEKKAMKINKKLAIFARQKNVLFANPHKRLCNEKKCAAELDGSAVYIDRQHITKNTADILVKTYLNQLSVKGLPKDGE